MSFDAAGAAWLAAGVAFGLALQVRLRVHWLGIVLVLAISTTVGLVLGGGSGGGLGMSILAGVLTAPVAAAGVFHRRLAPRIGEASLMVLAPGAMYLAYEAWHVSNWTPLVLVPIGVIGMVVAMAAVATTGVRGPVWGAVAYLTYLVLFVTIASTQLAAAWTAAGEGVMHLVQHASAGFLYATVAVPATYVGVALVLARHDRRAAGTYLANLGQRFDPRDIPWWAGAGAMLAIGGALTVNGMAGWLEPSEAVATATAAGLLWATWMGPNGPVTFEPVERPVTAR